MKTLIAGGPKTGKTTLSNQLSANGGACVVRHCDDLIGKYDWSEASEEISKWFDEPGDFVIEGVQVARALRKWLKRNETGKPCDMIYYGWKPFVELIGGQAAMKKGCDTVWNEIEPELKQRGVMITVIPGDDDE